MDRPAAQLRNAIGAVFVSLHSAYILQMSILKSVLDQTFVELTKSSIDNIFQEVLVVRDHHRGFNVNIKPFKRLLTFRNIVVQS